MTGGVLWLTAEVPDRDQGGGNQRQAYLLEALAAVASIDLVVAGRVTDETVVAAARQIVELDVAPIALSPHRLVRRARAAATTWVSRQPLDVAAFRPVRDAIALHLRSTRSTYDAVLVHHQVLAPLMAGPRFDRGRWALHLFHAAADRAEQLAAYTAHPLQRALLRRDGANARGVEHLAVDRADALIVATPQDASRLRRPSTPCSVVPQGVDIDRFRPQPLPDAPTVLFSGSLDYDPNVDGILWFVAAIWPDVLARVPDAELLVVGRHPVPAVRALDGVAGVRVHADVPSMAPWLARARVSIAPVRVGTGVRVKALEALAAGLPTVGTAVAFEGIDLGPAEAVTADSPTGFADAVVTLLTDDARAESQRAAGRAMVEARFSWKASAAQLADALLG